MHCQSRFRLRFGSFASSLGKRFAAIASESRRIAEKGRFKIFKAMVIIGERSSDLSLSLSLSLFELV